MMKKMFVFVLSFLLFFFVGCGSKIVVQSDVQNVEVEKIGTDTQIDVSGVSTGDSFVEEYCKNNGGNIRKQMLPDGYSISYCFFDDGSFCEILLYKYFNGKKLDFCKKKTISSCPP